MYKTNFREFAIESRNTLIDRIKIKLNLFYIDEVFKESKNGDVYYLENEKHNISLTLDEKQKRDLLIKRINEIGIEKVIEEAAYTWFNRLIAIRYMEIHDLLPLGTNNESLGIRVLSSNDNTPNPEILKFSNLINSQLDINFNQNIYTSLNNDNEKFKYVLLLVCNKLKLLFPDVFGGVTDYIDLLIPENMLTETGFITKLLTSLSEEDFNEVEIIGWLYQFYISEKKDEVFKDLKKNVKISKDNIPAATQLFTPNWIVKYMVENALGKTLVANKIIEENILVDNFKYYIKNNNIRYETNTKKIEDIKFFDPCCGSGHILVYAFEFLFRIYSSLGYRTADIPSIILSKNLFGMDVDMRARQLSILALNSIALKYDKNLLKKKYKVNIYNMVESNNIDINLCLNIFNEDELKDVEEIIRIFNDGKEYGSLLSAPSYNYKNIIEKINSEENIFGYELKRTLLPVIEVAEMLSQKYDIVVTNPPYMGQKGMSLKLSAFVKKYYGDAKTDLFSCFICRVKDMVVPGGYYAMITPPSILFLSSFDKLRLNLVETQTIDSVLHMGRGIFGVDFGSTSFVINNQKNNGLSGSYFKLHQRTFQYIDVNDIEKIFLNSKDNENYKYDFSKYINSSTEIIETDDDVIEETEEESGPQKIKYVINQDNFKKIDGCPIAYWASNSVIDLFKNVNSLEGIAEPKQGLATTDNNRFLRLWYEVDFKRIGFHFEDREVAKNSNYKWFPYNKGGEFRKWFGNNYYIVNYNNDGEELINLVKEKYPKISDPEFVIKNRNSYFKESITWSFISSTGFGVRHSDSGFIFDVGGSSCFPKKEDILYITGLLNSSLTKNFLRLLNPTMNFQVGDIKKIPFINSNNKQEIEKMVSENIELAKNDWDDYEISWDFTKHPAAKKYCDSNLIKDNIYKWISVCNERFASTKANEENINKEFINIYNLKNDIDYIVPEKEITISIPTEEIAVKTLISYVVGIIFGRYSIDYEGLIYAGKEYDRNKYVTFKPDDDNIIPISDTNDIYYDDDLVGMFKKVITKLYGENELSENIDYIANILGRKGTEISEETLRRYFINDFMYDHLKTYQKRPIYWMVDSGKKNGFKALLYSHRYNNQTISKIRVNYLHKTQDTYERIKSEILYKLDNDIDVTQRKEMRDRLNVIEGKIDECNKFDEKISHIANQMIEIDLDDGIKVNYEKFADILAKIK